MFKALSFLVLLLALSFPKGARAQMTIVSSFNPGSAAEKKYVDPHTTAVMIRSNWSQLEASEGVYNWMQLDSQITSWTGQGKKVAIIASLAADSGVNTATPGYVLQNKQTTTVKCPAFPNPCPVTNTQFFVQREEAFIQALLAHLVPMGSSILYVRVGPMHGGESCPSCFQADPLAWGQESGVMSYLSDLATFVSKLHSPIQMVYDMNSCINNSWAAQMGDIFAKVGLGIGNDAASGKDVNGPGNGDWVVKFAQYPLVYHYLQQQNPDTIADTLKIIPFARTQGVDAFEINESILDAAYDPANPNYAQYHVQLQKVLQLK